MQGARRIYRQSPAAHTHTMLAIACLCLRAQHKKSSSNVTPMPRIPCKRACPERMSASHVEEHRCNGAAAASAAIMPVPHGYQTFISIRLHGEDCGIILATENTDMRTCPGCNLGTATSHQFCIVQCLRHLGGVAIPPSTCMEQCSPRVPSPHISHWLCMCVASSEP